MMIKNTDLATTVIHSVIFHDVPSSRKGAEMSPTLSETETIVDTAHKNHLRTKLTQVLGSKDAYPIQFNPASASPVPVEVKALTKSKPKSAAFVQASQKMAEYLFEQSGGSVSPGLLCVISGVANSREAIMLMKLEREEGAQLEFEKGKKTFAMSVLDNLVLTEGTRLFKTAMFVRVGSGDGDFKAAACDGQVNVTSSKDIAKFWLRFLGCTFLEEPRVATQKFYEAAMRFVSSAISDPVVKNDVYEHLHSQLKAPKQTFSPKGFIENFVPKEYRAEFTDHLTENKVALTSFSKDLMDIQNQLKRRSYETHRGALITVPASETDMVVISAQDVLVKDSVKKIR